MVTIHIDHSKPSPGRVIIQAWMQESAATLAAHDADNHLELISRELKVHGVPGLDTIDYNDWGRRFSMSLPTNR